MGVTYLYFYRLFLFDEEGRHHDDKWNRNQFETENRVMSDKFLDDSTLLYYDNSLPIELLYSEFFNVSSQSVINYRKGNHRFLVVFSITVDLKTDVIPVGVENTMHMLSVYAKTADCHTVVFTSTPIVISLAISLGHTVVTNTSCNPYGFPFIQPILEVTRLLYNPYHISYLNSDILFTSVLFSVIRGARRAYLYPIYELAMRVREIKISPITNLTSVSEINNYIETNTAGNRNWRHQDSAVENRGYYLK